MWRVVTFLFFEFESCFEAVFTHATNPGSASACIGVCFGQPRTPDDGGSVRTVVELALGPQIAAARVCQQVFNVQRSTFNINIEVLHHFSAFGSNFCKDLLTEPRTPCSVQTLRSQLQISSSQTLATRTSVVISARSPSVHAPHTVPSTSADLLEGR
jgi:hypothetical protein